MYSYKQFKKKMKRLGYTRHHRRPVSLGGSSDSHNIIWLPANKHRSWHALVANMSPQEIAKELSDKYLDPDWQLIAIRKTPVV